MRRSTLLILGIVAGALFMTRSKWSVPVAGFKYLPLIYAAAGAYDVPFLVLARLLWQESHFNPNARNPSSGALGIAQFMPATAAELGINPLNPEEAIPAAAKYLDTIRRYLNVNTWAPVLAGYNWGMGNVSRAMKNHGSDWLAAAPTETQNYVRNITNDTGVA